MSLIIRPDGTQVVKSYENGHNILIPSHISISSIRITNSENEPVSLHIMDKEASVLKSGVTSVGYLEIGVDSVKVSDKDTVRTIFNPDVIEQDRFMELEAQSEGPIRVSYFDPNIKWRPLYDIDLSTNRIDMKAMFETDREYNTEGYEVVLGTKCFQGQNHFWRLGTSSQRMGSIQHEVDTEDSIDQLIPTKGSIVSNMIGIISTEKINIKKTIRCSSSGRAPETLCRFISLGYPSGPVNIYHKTTVISCSSYSFTPKGETVELSIGAYLSSLKIEPKLNSDNLVTFKAEGKIDTKEYDFEYVLSFHTLGIKTVTTLSDHTMKYELMRDRIRLFTTLERLNGLILGVTLDS